MTTIEQSFQDFEQSDRVLGGIVWQIKEKPNLRGGVFTSIVIGVIADIKIQIGVRSEGQEKSSVYCLYTIDKQIISFYNINFETTTVQAACLEAVRLLKEKVENWHLELAKI